MTTVIQQHPSSLSPSSSPSGGQQQDKSAWLTQFIALEWYDHSIEFLFKFVAKTSEPLLAAGLVMSAADFLTKGALMRNNPGLSFAWAWTQALAIESSSGVVFAYAINSFKSRDKLKGWLYLILALLLALTGGTMLYMQLSANTSGVAESAFPAWLIASMAILRVIVSIGYVFMCRVKHMSFSIVSPPVPPETASETPPSIYDETLQLILAKLAKLEELEQSVMTLQHGIITLSMVPSVPPETGETAGETPPELPVVLEVQPVEEEVLDGVEESESGDESSLEARIAEILASSPGLSSREVASLLGKPHSTVYRYLVKVKQFAVPGETLRVPGETATQQEEQAA